MGMGVGRLGMGIGVGDGDGDGDEDRHYTVNSFTVVLTATQSTERVKARKTPLHSKNVEYKLLQNLK